MKLKYTLKCIKFTSLISIQRYIQNMCHCLNTLLEKKEKKHVSPPKSISMSGYVFDFFDLILFQSRPT